MLEGAVILVPLFAIFFAIFDFGMGLFLKNTMQFAVRQGVRYAITSQVMPGMGQDDSIKTIVTQNSMGFLNYVAPNGQGMNAITINYYNPQTLALVTGVGSNIGGNVVQVSANGLAWTWMVPLMRTATPFQFSVSSADIMEASPNGIPPPR